MPTDLYSFFFKGKVGEVWNFFYLLYLNSILQVYCYGPLHYYACCTLYYSTTLSRVSYPCRIWLMKVSTPVPSTRQWCHVTTTRNPRRSNRTTRHRNNGFPRQMTELIALYRSIFGAWFPFRPCNISITVLCFE